jgi:hypothetical protein
MVKIIMSSSRASDILPLLQNGPLHYTLTLDHLLAHFNSNPDLINKKLLELLETVKAFPMETATYVQLKGKIQEFEALSPSKKIERQLLLREIDALLEEIYQFLLNNELLRLEFLKLAKSIFSHINGDLKWLEYFSRSYLQERFASEKKKISKFEFFPKLDGDQLGRRGRIQYTIDEEKKEIYYFAKTHQDGSRRNEKNALPVDPKELFFYKVLELTGLGPKVHFYLNPLVIGSYFIATQDEAFTKIPNKQKFFKTYGQLKDHLEEKPDAPFTEMVVLSHLLQKIFHLWDLITNSGNFGQVVIDGSRYKWRIIDFRITSLEQYENKNIFKDYLANNEMEGYIGPLKAATKNLTEDEKVDVAIRVLNNLQMGKLSYSRKSCKLPLKNAIFSAFCYIARLLQDQVSLGCLGFPLAEKIGLLAGKTLKNLTDNEIIQELYQLEALARGDLGRYVIAILENFKGLSDDVEKYKSNSKAIKEEELSGEQYAPKQ